MPERVYEAKHEIFNEQMKAVKGSSAGLIRNKPHNHSIVTAEPCGGAVWCAPRDHQTVRSTLC